MSRLSMTHSFLKSRRLKTDPTQYIINQQQADQQLKQLIALIKEWHFNFQMFDDQKIEALVAKINNIISVMNEDHRSFWKVKSLASTLTCLTWLKKDCILEAKKLVIIQSMNKSVSLPYYRVKLFLLQILILYANPEPQKKSEAELEILEIYKDVQKTKFRIDKRSLDHRLWQNETLNQILVHQYYLIIQQIEKYDQWKSNYLFHRGIQIAEKYLGSCHHLTVILKNVLQIKKSTNRLITREYEHNLIERAKSKSPFMKRKKKKAQFLRSTSKNRKYVALMNQRIGSVIPRWKTPVSSDKGFNSSNQTWTTKKCYNHRNDMSSPEMQELAKISKIYNKKATCAEEKKKVSASKLEKYLASPSAQIRKGGFIMSQADKIQLKNAKINSGLQKLTSEPAVPPQIGSDNGQAQIFVRNFDAVKQFAPMLERVRPVGPARKQLQNQSHRQFLPSKAEQESDFCQLI